MSELLDDIRYGLRMLRKSPGFTAVAILTLAIAIGANTAVFSVVNGVLLNSLPFHDPDKLVMLFESKPNFTEGSISYPNFLDWQRDNRSFSSMTAYRPTTFSLTATGEAEQVRGKMVSATFFSTLGVNLTMGRMFAPEEDRLGAGPVVLVTEGFWKRKLGSSQDILGTKLILDDEAYTIIGVVPGSFHMQLPNFQDNGEVYVPLGQWKYPPFRDRSFSLGMKGIGRLKDGITFEQARADMDAVTRNLAVAYPQVDAGERATLVPLKKKMVGNVQPFLVVLLAAVSFVLLIACVNVANLLLARSTGRTREFAVRAALGASQGRVIRQLLTESILLGIGGGALGLLLAAFGLRAALGALPLALPRAQEIGLDTRVLIFNAAVSILAGVLFGLAPAFKTARPNLQQTLKEGGRGTSGAHHRAQGVFVVVEMAMALVLLIGAGLMVRSLMRIWGVNPGFDPHHVVKLSIAIPTPADKSADNARSYFRQIHDKIASVPGVQAVSLSNGTMPMLSDDEELFWIEGQPKPASDKDMDWALRYTIEPEYFHAMKISLLRGRLLGAQDNEHSSQVMVVDTSFASQFFPNENPVGKHIYLKTMDKPLEIVGVVDHIKQWGLDSDEKQTLHAQIYTPFMQMQDKDMQLAGGVDAVLRFGETDSGGLDSVRHAVASMNAEQFIYDAQPMEGIISQSLATQRFFMILLGAFATLAFALASIGIYGVVSYVVGQRTHEIGVRMALGAQPLHILKLILAQGGILALAGVGLGLAAALGLTRLMASLLYGVRATDPLTFAAVAALLTLVALAACYIPARRAAKVDPMVALRYE
jgi:predicted permease